MSVNTSTYVGVAGTWAMNTSKPAPKPEKSFATDGTPESVFDPDHRSLVDENDIKDGGKYRSIVKLQMRYEGQPEEDTAYAMGTGWLISPDTLVTAGHNVFDWSGYGQGLGRAVHIKAYIGYHGRENVESPIVQSRVAKEIVTTAEWIMSRENRHRDVAIIRVDRPFEGNLRCFTYKSTPKLAEEMIGVVGYPADKVLQYEDGRQEKGAQMYEQFNDVVYNIETDAKNPQGMIKYRISTFGGQSGAPIIRKGSRDTVIGTHVYGGGDKNQGNPIGKFGNDLDGLLKVFSGSLPTVSDYQGIKLVRYATAGASGVPAGAVASQAPAYNSTGSKAAVPTTTPVNGQGGQQCGVPVNKNGFSQTGFQQAPTAGSSHDAESFIDDLAKVGKFVAGTFGKGLLQQPIFKNPKLGGPLAVAAGAALNALVNSAESGFSDPGAAARGVTERAALAEAALQTVLKLEEGPVMHKVINDMKQNYIRFAPSSYKTYATQLAPAIAMSANNILTTTNYNTQGTVIRGRAPNVPGIYAAESASNNSNEFLSHLLTTPTSQVEAEVQPEGFGFNFSGLGSIISQGFNMAKPFLGQAAKWGGQKLLDVAVSHLAGRAESALDGPSASPEDIEAAEILLKRAVMGEAALQAVSKLSRQELQAASLIPGSAGPGEAAHAESWFSGIGDFFKSAVQTVAPIALKVAPVVVGALNPAAGAALGGAISVGRTAGFLPESANTGGNNGYLAPPGGENGLRKKRSVNDLLSEGLLQVSNTLQVNSPAPPTAQFQKQALSSSEQEPAAPAQKIPSPAEMQEMERKALDGALPRLEYLRMRNLVDGPDPNEDKLVFVRDDE